MNLEKIQKSDVLERLGLEKDKYILLSAHREENIDSEKNFLSLFTAINALAEKYNMPILYSCHPRSKHRLEKSGFQLDPRVRVNEPLGFNDYNKLQMNALAIVSDSGTLPEESSFCPLGIPLPPCASVPPPSVPRHWKPVTSSWLALPPGSSSTLPIWPLK